MLGFLDDAWQRFVGNMGVTGPDKGKGGNYLVIPPGYTGEIPDGYFLLKPPTNRNFLFLRGSIKHGLKPAVENITSNLKVYPLKDAANPVATEFVNMSNKAFNTVFPSDLCYFEALNQVIQDEPIDAISPEVSRECSPQDRWTRHRLPWASSTRISKSGKERASATAMWRSCTSSAGWPKTINGAGRFSIRGTAANRFLSWWEPKRSCRAGTWVSSACALEDDGFCWFRPGSHMATKASPAWCLPTPL